MHEKYGDKALDLDHKPHFVDSFSKLVYTWKQKSLQEIKVAEILILRIRTNNILYS